jgi:hypothetical protein
MAHESDLATCLDPREFGAEEARAKLAWSQRRAHTSLGLAFDLFLRLPALAEAMPAGRLDLHRVKRPRLTTHATGPGTDICDFTGPDAPRPAVRLAPIGTSHTRRRGPAVLSVAG